MPSDGYCVHEHTKGWVAIDHLYAEWDGMPVASVGYGWSRAHHARTSLRVTLDGINMVVVDGAALHVEKTVDLDGTVHADAADVADVRRMCAGLVAARSSSSGSAAAGR